MPTAHSLTDSLTVQNVVAVTDSTAKLALELLAEALNGADYTLKAILDLFHMKIADSAFRERLRAQPIR